MQSDEVVVEDESILSVTTGVKDQTSRSVDEKFTVSDITIEITGVTAEPKIFSAISQPQIVDLATGGFYGVTVFLKVTDANGILTQWVDLAKIQDIIDGNQNDFISLH